MSPTKHPGHRPSAAQLKSRLRVLRMVKLLPPLADLVSPHWDDGCVAAWILFLREGYTVIRRVDVPGGQTDRLALTDLGIEYLEALERDAAATGSGPNGA